MNLNIPHWRALCLRAPRTTPLVWGALVLVVGHAWLLPAISDPRSSVAAAIQLLQPLLSLVAIVTLWWVAQREPLPLRRWAWRLHALAMALSLIGVLLQILARWSGRAIVTPLTTGCFLAGYACAMLGTVIYISPRAWRLASTLRLALEGLVATLTVALGLPLLLPQLIQPWSAQRNDALIWLALDAGVLAMVGLLRLRFGAHGGPLLPLVLLAQLCNVLGNTIFLMVAGEPDAPLWFFVPGPLYSFSRLLLAYGAYRSLAQPPQLLPAGALLATRRWWLLTLAPTLLALVVLVQTTPIGAALLLAALIVRECVVALNQRQAAIMSQEVV